MDLKKVLGIGAIAAIGIYFWSQRTAAKNLKIQFHALDIKKPSGFNLPDMFAKFRLINPTNSGLTIGSIIGEIFINGKPFSTINSLEKITIPGNQEMIYKLQMRIPVINAITTILNMIRNRQKLSVRFKGTANSNGIIIPIDQTIFVQQ